VRAVVQRVSTARVTVDGETVGAIGAGLLVLLGVTHGDTPADAAHLAGKIVGLRIFDDEEGRMNRSAADVGGAILVVSQFTLYGDCRKGRRPSFDSAAAAPHAQAMYDEFVRQVRGLGVATSTGVFQAHMDVELVNDGPVTLVLDSPAR